MKDTNFERVWSKCGDVMHQNSNETEARTLEVAKFEQLLL